MWVMTYRRGPDCKTSLLSLMRSSEASVSNDEFVPLADQIGMLSAGLSTAATAVGYIRSEEYMEHAPVLQSVDLPNGSGRLVLFDWSANKQQRFENLVCLDASGALVWRATLPQNTAPDTFTSVKLDGDVVRAYAWSGYSLTLDRMTGKTLRCVFTK
jgi:hypothetical protein